MTKKKPSPRDEEIGRRIRTRRLSIGMSQTVLGDKLGITFQQVQKYEKGVNRIGSGRLEELAQILGVPVGYFFDDEPSAADTRAVLNLANTAQTMRLLKAFSDIKSPETRQALVNLAVQVSLNERDGVLDIAEIHDAH
jgi:transcriptional regulator with XRE-family HTH domain